MVEEFVNDTAGVARYRGDEMQLVNTYTNAGSDINTFRNCYTRGSSSMGLEVRLELMMNFLAHAEPPSSWEFAHC